MREQYVPSTVNEKTMYTQYGQILAITDSEVMWLLRPMKGYVISTPTKSSVELDVAGTPLPVMELPCIFAVQTGI